MVGNADGHVAVGEIAGSDDCVGNWVVGDTVDACRVGVMIKNIAAMQASTFAAVAVGERVQSPCRPEQRLTAIVRSQTSRVCSCGKRFSQFQ